MDNINQKSLFKKQSLSKKFDTHFHKSMKIYVNGKEINTFSKQRGS